MTAVTATNLANAIGTGTGTGTTGTANNSLSNLGINDFITLMTTQLQNQDPTQPQDPTQMVAQLAQFSTVSGVQQLNTSMSSLTNQLLSSQAVTAVSLVGRSVLVPASTATMAAGASINGVVATPTGASNINLLITNANGQEVRQMTVPATSGASSFTWDGTDDSGKPVAAGQYLIQAAGNVGGTNIAAATALQSKVDSVTIDSTNNSVQLNTDALGSVSLSSVQQVF